MNDYQSLPPFSREDAESKLRVAQGEELCLLLLSLSEADDWKWAQETYLGYINNEDKWVASSAITGLGHLARIAGKIEKEKVINALNKVAESRKDLEGKIGDAMSDINMFI